MSNLAGLRHGRALLILVLTLAVTITGLAAPPRMIERAAAAAGPSSVTLSSSATELSTTQTATLTATASAAVDGSGSYIQIFDETSSTPLRVASCSTGSVCTTTVGLNGLASKVFRAYVDGGSSASPTSPYATSDVLTLTQLPWQITLATSADTVSTSESATLTATANQALASTGYRIFIFDRTAGYIDAVCSSGSTCTAQVQIPNDPSHTYVAYVAKGVDGYGNAGYDVPDTPDDLQASSDPLVITRLSWTIALTTSAASISTDESATLTATVNQTVTGTNYRIFIYDRTAGYITAECASGATCSTQVKVPNDPSHTYVAYVANGIDGYTSAGYYATDTPDDLQIASDPLVEYRSAWALALHSDLDTISTGESATLTATANQTVTGTNYRIFIYDRTAGFITAECASGTTCTAQVKVPNDPSHTYVAYVANGIDGYTSAGYYATDTPDDLQIASDPATVYRQQWALTLVNQSGAIKTDESATLTATANQTVTGTNYRIFIYDRTAGFITAECASGATCSTQVKVPNDPSHTYVAYVANGIDGYTSAGYYATDTPDDLQFASSAVVVHRVAWLLQLQTDMVRMSTADRPTLTATANQTVTGTNYRIFIYDRTAGYITAECASGTTCSTQTQVLSGPPHTFVAYVAKDIDGYGYAGYYATDTPDDLQKTSDRVVIARDAWAVTLTAGSATANQSVSGTPYRIFIYDRTAGYIAAECGSGSTCGLTAPTTAHSYVAYVAKDIDGYGYAGYYATDTPDDLQADSNGYSLNTGSGYQGEPLKLTALGDAAPQTCKCSAADPVDLATGALTEAGTDLTIPARGLPLSQDRTYNSQHTDTAGWYGYGWTSTWTSHLSEDATTSAVTVTLDDGSQAAFQLTDDGTYAAPFYVLSTLTKNPDGSWTFIRDGAETYTFDTDGQLAAITDTEGNTLTATYTNGILSAVTDAAGRSLTYTSSGGHITSVTSPAGKTVNYAYDGYGNLATVTYPGGGTVSYGYDDGHHLVSLTNQDGGVTTNTYDTTGRVTEQTDPLGQTTAFAYTSDGVTITHPSGMVEVKRYSDGLLLADTTAYGTSDARTWTYTYDPATLSVATITDPAGNVEKNTYDDAGNKISHTDALNRLTTWTYAPDRRLLSQTDPDGTVTTYGYDSRNRLTTVTRSKDGVNIVATTIYDDTAHPYDVTAMTDGTGRTTTFEYDTAGNRTAIIDPAGRRTTMEYNGDGWLTRQVDPAGNAAGANPADYATTYTYDGVGNVISQTDPAGRTSTATYDPAGNPLTQTNGAGETTSYTYDALGRPITVTYPDGTTTTDSYDTAGNLVSKTDALGDTWTYTYDLAGNQTSATDPLGNTTRYTYDLLDQLTATTYPSGATETTTYDAVGNVLTSTDARGGVTQYTYDTQNRPLTVTDPAGRTTKYGYANLGEQTTTTLPDGTQTISTSDAEGRQLSYTNGAGETTSYAYDPSGHVTSYTDAMGRQSSYTYNTDGLVATETQPGGVISTYTYDHSGLLTAKSYSTPNDAPVSYTYDGAGRRATMTDGTGTTTYTYHNGELAFVTDEQGATVGYTYDQAGRLSGVDYPNGTHVTRTLDADGQLTAVTDGSGNQTTFDYNADGDWTQTRYPNGVVQDFNRDPAGDPTQITVTNAGGTKLASWAYEVNPAGQVTSTNDSLTGTTAAFTYNPRGQLIGTGTGAGSYGYDYAGNLNSLTDGSTLTYDKSDRLTSKIAADGSTTTSYTFNDRGDRTSVTDGTNTTSLGYDSENQLTSLTTPDTGTWTYSYDGDGLRSSASNGTDTSSFVWDRHYDNAELLTDGTNLYIYGPDGAPVEQVNLTTGNTEYLHADRLGSIRLTTDATGGVVGTASFDPYGNPVGTPTTGTPFGFAGEYTDPTGLVYLRARYYDPVTGQFISLDPKVAVTHSGYGYVYGDPLNGTDPSGACFGPDFICNAASSVGSAVSSGMAAAQDVTSKTVTSLRSGASAVGSFVAAHKTEIARAAIMVGATAAIGACMAATVGVCAAPAAAVLVEAGIGAVAGALDYTISADCPTAGGYLAAAGIGAALAVVPGGVLSRGSRAAVSAARAEETALSSGFAGARSTSARTVEERTVGATHQHGYEYAPRVRARAVEDPRAHNFPYSFDDEILRSEPILEPHGALTYRLGGTLNGKKGWFELGVNQERGVIYHRTFRGAR